MKVYTEATERLLKPLKLSVTDRLSVDYDDAKNVFRLVIWGKPIVGDFKGNPSHAAHAMFVQRIPEHKHLSSEHLPTYEVAATDYTSMMIHELWPSSQVEFTDEALTIHKYLVASCMMQEHVAEAYATFKLDGTLPPEALALEVRDERPLTPYQRLACRNASLLEGYGLFMKQGTGKTAPMIAEVCNEGHKKFTKELKPFLTLIVCPKGVRTNWVREFENFATRKGKVTVLRGGMMKRIKAIIDARTVADDDEYSVVVCGYETMVNTWLVLSRIEWDLSILDEGHNIKNTKTKRFKYAMMLRDVSARRRILTGTPITNTALDLYAMFEFMGRGWSGFTNYKAWRDFYAVFEKRGERDTIVALQNLPFMRERLARLSYSITKEEALPDLPSKVYDIAEVEMSSEQQHIYDEVAKNLAVEIEDLMARENDKQLVITNVLTKLLRLAQITSGFVKWDAVIDPETSEILRPARVERLTPNPKLNALIEILTSPDKVPGVNKSIVWCCWTDDIDAISERLTELGIKHVVYNGEVNEHDREEAKRIFNCEPDCQVFIGNAGAGGTGLNLMGYPYDDTVAAAACPSNADHTIYYSQDWSPVKREQSGDRNHRKGTRCQVRETDLCVPNTVDEQIRARVLGKITAAMQINDVREILRAVLYGITREAGDDDSDEDDDDNGGE